MQIWNNFLELYSSWVFNLVHVQIMEIHVLTIKKVLDSLTKDSYELRNPVSFYVVLHQYIHYAECKQR